MGSTSIRVAAPKILIIAGVANNLRGTRLWAKKNTRPDVFVMIITAEAGRGCAAGKLVIEKTTLVGPPSANYIHVPREPESNECILFERERHVL